MTLLAFIGFEDGGPNPPTDFTLVNGPIYVTTQARSGDHSLAMAGGAKRIYHQYTAHATVTAGVAYRAQDDVVSTSDLIRIWGSGFSIPHIQLRFTPATNTVRVYRGAVSGGGTELGNAVVAGLTHPSWIYFELKATCHDTTGMVEVRVNGQSVLSLTGQDTRNAGATGTYDAVTWGHEPNENVWLDDIYICDGAGSSPFNGFLGDIKIAALHPNGNGNSSGLTGSDGNSTDNYLLVDEVTPSASDYNGHATATTKDTYTLSDIGASGATIYGIKALTHALKSDAGAKSGRTVVRTSSTDYTSADHVLGTSMGCFRTYWLLNPNTGVAWTLAEVEALEAGFEVRT